MSPLIGDGRRRAGGCGGPRGGSSPRLLPRSAAAPGNSRPREPRGLWEKGIFFICGFDSEWVTSPVVLFRGQNPAGKRVILISRFSQSCSVFVTRDGDETQKGFAGAGGPYRGVLRRTNTPCSSFRLSPPYISPAPRVTACPGDHVSHPSRRDRRGSDDAAMPRAALFASHHRQRVDPELIRALGSHPRSGVFQQAIRSGEIGRAGDLAPSMGTASRGAGGTWGAPAMSPRHRASR